MSLYICDGAAGYIVVILNDIGRCSAEVNGQIFPVDDAPGRVNLATPSTECFELFIPARCLKR